MGTFVNDWQGIGADGTTLTAANSDDGGGTALSTVDADSFVIDDAAALSAPSMPLGLRHVPVSSTVKQVIWNMPAAEATALVVTYFRRTATPTTAHNLMQVRHGSGTACTLQMTTTGSGRIVILNAAGTNIYNNSAANLTVNQWYRIEFRVTRGVTTLDGAVSFQLFTADSSTPVASFSTLATNTGTADLTNIRWGRTSGATTDLTTEHWGPMRVWSGADDPGGHVHLWPNDFVATVTDPVGVGDAASQESVYSFSQDEAVGTVDGQFTAVERLLSADGIGVLDDATSNLDLVGSITDELGVQDSTFVSYDLISSDVIGVIDEASQETNASRSMTDAVALDDTSSTVGGLNITFLSLLGSTDEATSVSEIERILTNDVTGLDDVLTEAFKPYTLNDSLEVSDSSTAEIGFAEHAQDVQDPVGLTDFTSVEVGFISEITDSFGLVDDAVVAAEFGRIVASIVSVLDNSIQQIVRTFEITDDFQLIDPSISAETYLTSLIGLNLVIALQERIMRIAVQDRVMQVEPQDRESVPSVEETLSIREE